jgi:hypothetical protein
MTLSSAAITLRPVEDVDLDVLFDQMRASRGKE